MAPAEATARGCRAAKTVHEPDPMQSPGSPVSGPAKGSRRGSPSHAEGPCLLPASARPTQSSEPILFPKLRIRLADFPYLHCSIGQRLFTLETGCGHGYDPRRESQHFPRIFKDQPERTGRRRRRGALRSRRPSLRSNRFQGSRSLTRKDNSSRGPGQRLRARSLHSVRPPRGRRAPPSGSGILTRFPFAQGARPDTTRIPGRRLRSERNYPRA